MWSGRPFVMGEGACFFTMEGTLRWEKINVQTIFIVRNCQFNCLGEPSLKRKYPFDNLWWHPFIMLLKVLYLDCCSCAIQWINHYSLNTTKICFGQFCVHNNAFSVSPCIMITFWYTYLGTEWWLHFFAVMRLTRPSLYTSLPVTNELQDLPGVCFSFYIVRVETMECREELCYTFTTRSLNNWWNWLSRWSCECNVDLTCSKLPLAYCSR